MKAVAFANNDMAIMAWTFGGKLPGCLGFAIYRIDVRAGTEICLPAMATFQGQDATDTKRTTADDPVQKFYWKDVTALRGGVYRYRIVPMSGKPGALQPMSLGALTTNSIELTPHLGALSAYFNRGILATQSTARKLDAEPGGGSRLDKLMAHIVVPDDPLRHDLEGQLNEALTTLSDEAEAESGEVFCALYEFQDPEAIQHLAALKGDAHLILSNMPSGKGDSKTNDAYAKQREDVRGQGVDTIDRFMPSGHIGHNKFEVLVEGGAAKAVLFGSTNWTSNALCAQTNNAIVAQSPAIASAYLDYWNRLKADTNPAGEGGHAQQGTQFRAANGRKLPAIDLEDKSGAVQLWFSPNTPHQRAKSKTHAEAAPPDLAEVFDVIANAQQAILFLAFEPGSPSIIDAIAKAQKAKPSLFVRGAVTASNSAGDFQIMINSDGDGDDPPPKHQKGDAPVPEDYRVIHTRGVTASDAFGQWEQELNQAGHAVIHDKIVVVDPFSDNCVVVTGSHNLGYQASYNNDENLAIIRDHRALAEAYSAHCLDIYDHYVWRYYLQTEGQKAWHFLSTDDGWQDSYLSADNQVKSAELAFWLGATPHSDALPTPNVAASTRQRPALQAHVRGAAKKVKAPAKKAKSKGGAKKG